MSGVLRVKGEVVNTTSLTADHPSSSHAHNSAVLDVSQTVSASHLSDPVSVTRARKAAKQHKHYAVITSSVIIVWQNNTIKLKFADFYATDTYHYCILYNEKPLCVQ